jgi:hypothetical protein
VQSWRLANVGFGSVRAYRKVGAYGKVGALLLPRRELTPTQVLKNWPQGSMLRSQFSAIFANFRQKMAFFSKTNVTIKILHNLALF